MQYLLFDELPKRKQRLLEGRGHENPWLIWLAEEWGDIQFQCKEYARLNKLPELKELCSNFLIFLGIQGRKYNVIGLMVNQAKNTKANGAEGQGDYMEAYLNCIMGNVAVVRARQMGLGKQVVEALQQEAYPCLLDGVPVKHLTHGHYTERKRLQQPINKQPIRTVPLTIKVAGEEHLYYSAAAVKKTPEPPRDDAVNVSDRPSQPPQQQPSEPEDPISRLNRLFYNEPAVEPQQGVSDSISHFVSDFGNGNSAEPLFNGVADETKCETRNAKREMVLELQATGASQTQIIEQVFGAKPGDNQAYRDAVIEYRWLISRDEPWPGFADPVAAEVESWVEDRVFQLHDQGCDLDEIILHVWGCPYIKPGGKPGKRQRYEAARAKLIQIFEEYGVQIDA
jgi:hypothetical protein